MKKKSDKFILDAPVKSGNFKDQRLLYVNSLCVDGAENITLEALLEFLKEKRIDPENVKIPPRFRTYIMKGKNI